MPKVCSGEYLSSFGLTEPDAGSDAGGTRTTAVLDGDHWVLNGAKQFITNATHAGVLVITAKTDRTATGSQGISAFLVETDAPGFSLGKKENKLGMRASDTRALSFEDCRIPKDALLGELNRGFPLFMKTLDGGRISIAALALGIAQSGHRRRGALRDAAASQFGQPIVEFEMIQSYLAEMQTETDRRAASDLSRGAAEGRQAPAHDRVGHGQVLRGHGGDEGDDARGADPGRVRLHQGLSRSSGTSATRSCARSARGPARSRRSSSLASWSRRSRAPDAPGRGGPHGPPARHARYRSLGGLK